MSEHIDNSLKRKRALKGVIRQLHEGKSVEDVKADFAKLLQDVGASEIAEIEQALIAEGLPEMEVKRLCDVHVAVFRESLDERGPSETPPGHPIHTFRAENKAAEAVLGELQRAIDDLGDAPDETAWTRVHKLLQVLREYEKHYLRKENVLFPYLEKHGFAGPSSVMWAIHDDVRAGWKALDELLATAPGDDPSTAVTQVNEVFEPLRTAVSEMFYKEENILFPTSLDKLSGEEWVDIRAQEEELGYSYVKPEAEWPVDVDASVAPSMAATPTLAPERAVPSGQDLLPLDTGALTAEQINLMMTHLPVDITYVDAEDTVRYFSQGSERLFPRAPAVIGRKVQKCHPPSSLHRVQQILDQFRAGTRDKAAFWIQMGPRFVHIRYFALRNDAGEYQGTVEMVQDLTPLRALEGERRLLDKEE